MLQPELLSELSIQKRPLGQILMGAVYQLQLQPSSQNRDCC